MTLFATVLEMVREVKMKGKLMTHVALLRATLGAVPVPVSMQHLNLMEVTNRDICPIPPQD